jgi:hypothetical protein
MNTIAAQIRPRDRAWPEKTPPAVSHGMRHTNAKSMLLVISLLASACSGNAGEDTPPGASDSALFMACAESRGSLLELNQMLDGRKRVDTSTLEHGGGMLVRLAERVTAGKEVRANLERWAQALTAWHDQLRAMQPRVENGRLIEPDTSALDASLLAELRAVNEPLAGWVKETCADVKL